MLAQGTLQSLPRTRNFRSISSIGLHPVRAANACYETAITADSGGEDLVVLW